MFYTKQNSFPENRCYLTVFPVQQETKGMPRNCMDLVGIPLRLRVCRVLYIFGVGNTRDAMPLNVNNAHKQNQENKNVQKSPKGIVYIGPLKL